MQRCCIPVVLHLHLSLNHTGCWGTTGGFTTSFLHFSQFSTTLWDLPNSRPVHSLMLSAHHFFCLPRLLPLFTVPCKMVLVRPDERETGPYHRLTPGGYKLIRNAKCPAVGDASETITTYSRLIKEKAFDRSGLQEYRGPNSCLRITHLSNGDGGAV